ncbi:MAG: CvpA family protein [Lachnospiraceae bacterium]|nr:CvpA family protein [Lachnospiraceae bacterium]
MGHTMLLISVIVLALGGLIGYLKGFLKIAVTLAVLVLSVFIVSALRPVVTSFLMNNTGLYDTTKSTITRVIAEYSEEKTEDGKKPSEEEQLDGLTIPGGWKETILADYSPEAMIKARARDFAEYAGAVLARKVVSAAAFALTVLILVVGIHLVLVALDVIGKLPVIGGANKTLGCLLGIASAVLVLWLFYLIASSAAAVGSGWAVPLISEVEGSKVLSFFYDGGLLRWLGDLVLR